jgi:hypothetical protein
MMEKPRSGWTLESINEDGFYEICKTILETTCQNRQGKPITGHQSIKSLSATNRDMRTRLEPMVFRSICVDVRYWVRTLENLERIERCKAIQHHIRRFYLKIYLPHDDEMKRIPELPERFVGIFRRAPKLEKLSISVPDKEVESYQLAIQKPDTDLSSVRTLAFGKGFEWLVELCPQVTTISTCDDWPTRGIRPAQPSYDLVRIASLATKLRVLEIKEYWSAELIEHIATLIPNLQGLGLLGMLQYFKLGDLLTPLSRFRDLKTLSIPMASELGIGFNPPDCGNAYIGPDGEGLARQVEEDERQAEERASRMIFSVCPRLEVLWIGRSTKKSRPKGDDGLAPDESMVVNEAHSLFF